MTKKSHVPIISVILMLFVYCEPAVRRKHIYITLILGCALLALMAAVVVVLYRAQIIIAQGYLAFIT